MSQGLLTQPYQDSDEESWINRVIPLKRNKVKSRARKGIP
jgi:hypothetical protein